MHPLYHTSPLYCDEDLARLGESSGKAGDHRDPFERDRARIIHSFSFRRLQSKTQIFALHESAFLRTRLTHSLEVGNIGRALTAVINRLVWPGYPLGDITPAYEQLLGPVDTSLIEAACLAHDLGHPPFGHRGEEALNHCVSSRWPKQRNGFEGNGQTLRILTNSQLEVHGEHYGLNLTRATLQAILKYPVLYEEVVNDKIYPTDNSCPPFKSWAPPKCIHGEEREVLNWLLQPFSESDAAEFRTFDHRPGRHARSKHKTLEASIVELADDIAYGTHDVEDAFFAKLITPEIIIDYLDASAFDNRALFDTYTELIRKMGRGEGSPREAVFAKKAAASELIGRLIASVELQREDRFHHPRLAWRARLPGDHRLVLDALKDSVYEVVINGPSVQNLEYRGGIVIKKLFDTYYSAPELLTGKPGHLMREAASDTERIRILTDYIAGMTDDYAERNYNRLFHPGSGSVFDKL